MEWRTSTAEQDYAAVVRAAEHLVIGLDFDGTLAPIVDDPERPTSTPTPVTCSSISPNRSARSL